ncbi:MAG: TIR domain-containing protein [Phycisphaerae bacterium]|nr:TIR domain-containing protein [Phycisphaerales bacterium]
MKVFLSWSGSRSHRVALVFRDWLPSVIQELEPYVSSEDIDKGARWSTDIAKELEDSSFGILCVTRDNINAPWLTFEAGALSKTMDKASVCPFLFDIKRSEVNGPVLQFQSTICEKEDLKKLVRSLNKACDKSGLKDERLDKAFEVWYPTLDAELAKLRDEPLDAHAELSVVDTDPPQTQEILEEILELSRINQKLIRNPDGSLGDNLQHIKVMLSDLIERSDRNKDPMARRRLRRLSPVMLDELLSWSMHDPSSFVGIQIALSLVKNPFPWLYDAGSEAVAILRSRRKREEKHEAVQRFLGVVDFTFEHPLARELVDDSRHMRSLCMRLQEFLRHAFEISLQQMS